MRSDYLTQTGIWRFNIADKGYPYGKYVNNQYKSRILYRAKQVFPVVLFPSEIIVEELRIIHIKQMGPWTSDVFSIMATDIASVEAANGLLIGHIHIKSLTGGPEIFVDTLSKRDVYRIRGIVEGIAMSAREGLKVKSQDLETERQSLYQAGRVN